MSVPLMLLKGVLSSVENLIKSIDEKRDFMLKQISDKGYISSAQTTLLFNSLVNQIIGNEDFKPDSQLTLKSLSTDPQQVFKDQLEKEKQIQSQLKIKCRHLENKLNLRVIERKRFQKLYENCLQINSNKEIVLNDQIKKLEEQIKGLKGEIERYLKSLLFSILILFLIFLDMKKEK